MNDGDALGLRVCADAWDEGYATAVRHLHGGSLGRRAPGNPYRQYTPLPVTDGRDSTGGAMPCEESGCGSLATGMNEGGSYLCNKHGGWGRE